MRQADFNQFFRGFHFIGCAVRSREIVYLLCRRLYDAEEGCQPDEVDVEKRVVNIVLNRKDAGRYGSTTLENFGVCNVAIQSRPKPHSVTVDYQGRLWAQGSGILGYEELDFDLDKGPQRGGVGKVKTIGENVYGVGARRSVCKRVNVGEWVPVWDGLPVPTVRDASEFNHYGFRDIDGFNESDIYAVGGEGDVWHFNGTSWRQLAFPSKLELTNVCCGGDGHVYISDRWGETYQGRAGAWQKVSDSCSSSRFQDVVWYQGELWASSQRGVWCLKETGFETPDLPDFALSSTGAMSAAHGMLLLAGWYQASLFDGREWTSLVDLSDLYRRYGGHP